MSEREEKVAQIREKTEVHAAVLAQLQQIEQEIHQVRSQLDQTQKSLQERALRKIEAQMTQEKIRETIFMNYQIEIAETVPPTPFFRRRSVDDGPGARSRGHAPAFAR